LLFRKRIISFKSIFIFLFILPTNVDNALSFEESIVYFLSILLEEILNIDFVALFKKININLMLKTEKDKLKLLDHERRPRAIC